MIDEMKRLVERMSVGVLVAFLFFALTCTVVWAQSTAQVTGTVRDQTGAVLPGVEVTATQTDTGITRSTVTDETGSYILQNLPLGPYRLEAVLPGFRTYAQTGIVLQVGGNPVINAVLEVGQVAETVEVQADAALVETRSTGVGQVMDNVRVLELPLNARQVTELILLSGAATGGPARGTNRFYPTIAVSVGGGMDNGLTYLLDGGTHNDPFGNLNMPLPFPDALQEFKVETSAVPAQYGQHSAGAVNLVTKSGTNEFHGSLFHFVRNKVFNARNAFALERDGLKRNQFGGVLGGPIVTNKLFFFGGYQGTTERSEPTDRRAFVPTPAMLAGDFTAVASTACRPSPLTLRAPFVNNRIDPRLFSPVALNILKKVPTTTDPCGEVRFGVLANSNEDIYVGRMDYQKTASHSLFARYTLHQLDQPTPYDGKTVLSATDADYVRRAQSAVVGDTYLFGSNVVNSFRATLLRTSNVKSLPDFFTLPEMGAKDVWYPEGFAKMMLVSIDGGFNLFSAPAAPGFLNSTVFEFSESLSWVRGAHQLAFGGNFLHQKMNVAASTQTAGSLVFRAARTGLGLGDFMLGQVDQWTQGILATWYPRQNYMAGFAQDTWKASSRLTVNLGARWEPYLPQWRKDNLHLLFRREWFDQGLKSRVFKNAPAGVLYRGDPGMPDNNKVSSNKWLHFAPRVGLSWDPAGDGRMTVRAAYGIFYDYPHMYQFNGVRSNPPFENRVTRTNVPLDDPWRGYPGGNPFPFFLTADAPFAPGSVYVNTPEGLRSPYAHQWNLSLQRQIGTDWMVAANYIGNSVIHYLNFSEANPAINIPGSSLSTSARRVLALANPVDGPKYGNINTADDGGTRSYNALWLQLQRRRARGLTVQANYTWSHCISDGDNVHSHSAGKPLAARRGANRGNCELDQRHNFNMSTVYEAPRFANPAARALASGWRVSGILKVASGSFLTVSCGCDNARSGTREDQRADQVLPDPYAPNRTIDRYLNSAAFRAPAIGTYGNSGGRSIAGPGSFTIDIGLARRFQIRENHSIELRAEAFNLPNHLNPGDPITLITNANFGRIQSAADPRIMQLALKYVF